MHSLVEVVVMSISISISRQQGGLSMGMSIFLVLLGILWSYIWVY